MRIVAGALGAVLFVVGCSSPDFSTNARTNAYGANLPSGDQGAGSGAPTSGDVGDELDDQPLVAADDSGPAPAAAPSALVGVATAQTTANVNLRSGPGTTYAILAVVPAGTVLPLTTGTPDNGFYEVTFNGTKGFCSARYLEAMPANTNANMNGGGAGAGATNSPTTAMVDVDGPASPDNAIARAQAAVGFSYWWGGGAWVAGGVTASNAGMCTGSCPSCTHSGSYGADCSGLVAKAWQFGTKALEVNAHPYSTSDFVNDAAGKWSTVGRDAMNKGDALVYRSGSSGHVVLYEKGDGWGSPTVYECRGCSYGCVHDSRTLASKYHAIRRAGF